MAKKNKKKKNLKSGVWDGAFFVGGLILGEVIAFLVRNIGFLKWLSFEVAFGIIEPIVLDLQLVKFTFGLSIHLNPAIVLFSLLGVIVGRMLRKYMSESGERHPELAPNDQLEDDYDDQDYDA